MVEILQYSTHDEAKLIHWKEESKVRIMIARTAGPKFSGPWSTIVLRVFDKLEGGIRGNFETQN